MNGTEYYIRLIVLLLVPTLILHIHAGAFRGWLCLVVEMLGWQANNFGIVIYSGPVWKSDGLLGEGMIPWVSVRVV
jgi:hypothetical protein